MKNLLHQSLLPGSSLLLRTTLLLCMLLFSVRVLQARQKTHPLFEVLFLQKKFAYSKKQLNKEILQAKTKDAVLALIRQKNFPPGEIVLVIQERNEYPRFWHILTGTMKNYEDARIILQSRNSAAAVLSRLSDFKVLFTDTLALLDTLVVTVHLRDPDYPINAFQLSCTCDPQQHCVSTIPVRAGNLLITPDLIAHCVDAAPLVRILHPANPLRVFATCHLCFFSPEQQEILLSIARWYRRSSPQMDLKKIAEQVAIYSAQYGGNPYFPQLTAWLSNHLNTPEDGTDY